MSHATRQLLGLGFLGLTLTVLPLAGQASAQATTDGAGTAATGAGTATTGTGTAATDRMGTTSDTRTTRDDGFNPGWLGLLGLAGLAGLMPKKVHPVATTTTHRTGDSTVR